MADAEEADKKYVNVSIDCSKIKCQCEGHSLVTSMDFLTEPSHLEALKSGKSISSFDSFAGNSASERQRYILDKIINLSYYADEEAENNVPRINIQDQEDSYNYTMCIQRSMWVLPDVNIDDVNPDRLATFDYMTRCQPASCQVWKPGKDYQAEDQHTFRFTKNVIPYVYDLTIQFRIHELPKEILPSLSEIDNLQIHKALLMERTKRDRTRIDSTRKVKSLFMIHKLENGLLISHITGVANTSIPTLIANMLSNFHEMVATEVAETCTLTRKYWKEVNDDAFNEPDD